MWKRKARRFHRKDVYASTGKPELNSQQATNETKREELRAGRAWREICKSDSRIPLSFVPCVCFCKINLEVRDQPARWSVWSSAFTRLRTSHTAGPRQRGTAMSYVKSGELRGRVFFLKSGLGLFPFRQVPSLKTFSWRSQRPQPLLFLLSVRGPACGTAPVDACHRPE